MKEAIKETIEEERIESFLRSIPPVSEDEMDDIKKIYGKPANAREVVHSEKIEGG